MRTSKQRSECNFPPPCTAPDADRPPGPVGGMETRSVPPGPYRATKLVRQRRTTRLASRGDGRHHFYGRTFVVLPWAEGWIPDPLGSLKRILKGINRDPCGTSLSLAFVPGAPRRLHHTHSLLGSSCSACCLRPL
ncbi:hypothetical protein PAL_GLEAN10023856 [Pteropus alecto]|uniref:Uncharacterized protein n=1 Tax=Pteropus alecto TaxID=9402 RepID=L5K3F6_PTEAL|nr:hypothetical protein PAL_GLEAN10023856 [Pteropus alecto]